MTTCYILRTIIILFDQYWAGKTKATNEESWRTPIGGLGDVGKGPKPKFILSKTLLMTIRKMTMNRTGLDAETPTLETKDLWQSAFLLVKGADLLDVVPRPNNGKREVVFIFKGDQVYEHIREFKSGQAMCNITNLKASMNHLKDEMFRVIKG